MSVFVAFDNSRDSMGKKGKTSTSRDKSLPPDAHEYVSDEVLSHWSLYTLGEARGNP